RSGSVNICLQWNAENWIFYPLDLTAGTSYELKLYARQNATSGADIEAAYGTANNAAAMTTSIIASSAVTSGDYQEFSGYFTPTSDGVYYIGIKVTTTFTPNYLSIDDISVDLAPSCLPPSDLASTGISTTTADIEWTAGDTETAWNISWGTPGYTPGDADEIDASSVINDAEYQITGLTADTHYDVYVQADCDADGMSTWAGPLEVFTGYCEATSSSNTYDYLSQVSSDNAEVDISYTGTSSSG